MLNSASPQLSFYSHLLLVAKLMQQMTKEETISFSIGQMFERQRSLGKKSDRDQT